ncbi:MAG TPA: HlyD family efflux transporter periplasmic adaptor subunit [Nitrospira sp.]|nr:HlyD family efflux transporter periplasmic adaptor subunit [Nitrospira sp.]
MAFGTLERQWMVWKAAWQAESGQPANRAVPEGPAAEFLPEALDIQESPPSPIGRALLWTILIACVAGAVWTTVVKIDTVTMAQGRVVQSGDSRVLFPHEAGGITAIHVHDGQVVKSGEVLIELDLTRELTEAEPQSHALVPDAQQKTQTKPSALAADAASAAQVMTKVEQNAGAQRVLSPIDGVVQQLAVQTVGMVVTPAQPVLTVVPLNRSLEVEVQLETKDVGIVHKGQSVEIKLATVQQARQGTIAGHVMREPDKSTSNTQAGLVSSIKVSLDHSTTRVGSTEVKLVPGMPVAVEIKTGQRRMIEYLLEPVHQLMDERVREWTTFIYAVRSFIERRNLS